MVAIFGMIRYCRKAILLESLVPHCKNFIWTRIVFCSCQDSDVGIIAEIPINNGTVLGKTIRIDSTRSWCNLDWIRKKNLHASTISSDHTRSTGHLPKNTEHCYDFDSIQQNLSEHSHDCNPTIQNQLSSLECFGTHITVGVPGRPLWTFQGPSESGTHAYDCVRTRIWHYITLRIVNRLF